MCNQKFTKRPPDFAPFRRLGLSAAPFQKQTCTEQDRCGQKIKERNECLVALLYQARTKIYHDVAETQTALYSLNIYL